MKEKVESVFVKIGIPRIVAGIALTTCITFSAAYSQEVLENSAGSNTDNAAESADNPSTPTAAVIISRDVVVADGDTLSSIAARELGKAGYAPQLAEFNALVTNAPLIPGNIIRIPIHVPARGEFARVVFVKGNVTASRTGDDTTQTNTDQSAIITIERDMEVLSGDKILTGSDGYVSIEFSSGSVVNMQPDTEALLSRLNCLPGDDSCIIEIKTIKGKVTSNVERRDDQPVDFRINTPYASAAVRGTVFDIHAGNALRIGVTEGSVEVTASDQLVDLESGFGSVVEKGQPPSPPVALLPAPVFKRVPARVAPEDAITWWPFADAASYDALIANDEAGNETLDTFEVADDQIRFDTINAGEYFLLVRAIDQNGLRGFASNIPITIAGVDVNVAPVTTAVTRQGGEFLVEIVNPPTNAAGFEIQIADTAAFVDPLSVDVNSTGVAVFRLASDQVFTRARILLDPQTVSSFGGISSSDN